MEFPKITVDWNVVAIGGLSGFAVGVLVYIVQRWVERPPKPFLVRNGSVVGEFLEAYCKKTGLDIDTVCLVAHDIGEDTTVFHIKSLDMFPEVWLGE